LAGSEDWEDREDEPIKKKSDGPGNKINTKISHGKFENDTCPDGK
jgi:hypothetical protein